MPSIRSLFNINPLKPFNFIVLFSILRVLSNHGATRTLEPFLMLNTSGLVPNNLPEPEVELLLSSTTTEGSDWTIAGPKDSARKKLKLTHEELSTLHEELSTLFEEIFTRKKFTELLPILKTINTPEKEQLALTIVTHTLENAAWSEQDPYAVLGYCHFIEAIHPSTSISGLAKETVIRGIYEQHPDLDKARLDYYVLNKNFSAAKKFLSNDLPLSYLQTFYRLELQTATAERLLSLSITELLMRAQIKPLSLPLTHPILKTQLLENGAEEDLYKVSYIFLTEDEQKEQKQETDALTPLKRSAGTFTHHDIILLKQMQKNRRNSLLLKREFTLITQILAEHFYVESSGEASFHQQLIGYAFGTGGEKDIFYAGILNTISKLTIKQEGYDASLLITRFCLANKALFPADYISREMATYQERLLSRRDKGTFLFLVYGKPEEATIRDLYPPDIAEKIIQKEKTLSFRPEPDESLFEDNTPSEPYLNYWPLMILLVIMVHTLVQVSVRERKQKKEKARQEKLAARQEKLVAPTKTTAAPNLKQPTLSDVILETIHEFGLLDKLPQDCPSMSEVLKGASLPVKKIYRVRNSDAIPETIELRYSNVLVDRLCNLYKTEKPSFDEACQFQDIRRNKAIDAIKTKCDYLVARYLSGEFNALIAENHKTPRVPTDPIMTTKEKVERLLRDERFPTDGRTPWVKLPTTTYSDLRDEIQDHSNDPQIKTQISLLEIINTSLEEKKLQLNELKKRYQSLVVNYDATLNPSNADFTEFYEKISGLQHSCQPLLSNIAEDVKQFNACVAAIEKRHHQLVKAETPRQESKEEHDARVQRIRDEKRRKKAEAEAKAQAEIEKKARALEADHKRQAERALENKDKQKNVLFGRWEKSKDLKITTALLYASTALFILNDVMNAEKEDDDYLRDACILSGTQLYEALRDLSLTVFGELLPRTEDLAHYRNVFAHVAMFFNLEPNEWKMIARHTYHHFFVFVDAYHRVNSSGEAIHIKAMPPLHLLMPDNIDERNQFKSLCQRYLTLKEKLSTVLTDEKVRYHDRAIHFLSIAMRSLIMQIDDMGNKIGLTAKNKHMQLLAVVRNQEAHNGKRTDTATLINLSEPINALMRTIKPANKAAKPSQVGVFHRKKKHPAPAPMPLPPKRPD